MIPLPSVIVAVDQLVASGGSSSDLSKPCNMQAKNGLKTQSQTPLCM
jgi:hypothetical protein